METFITIIYVIVAFMMVLAILLQAGKGGGLGSALGGGASQSVFGGGGGADFMARLTQAFAFTFMVCAMYLAYASAHSGSDFLAGQDAGSVEILDANDEINFEQLGINPQPLPTPEEGKIMQAKAAALVPPVSDGESADGETPEAQPPAVGEDAAGEGASAPDNQPTEGATGSNANVDHGGDSPESDRDNSPQRAEESQQDSDENVNSPEGDAEPAE